MGRSVGLILWAICAAMVAHADETAVSPYVEKLTGQEDFVYVWTSGVDGLGDGSDKLVTIGSNPTNRKSYTKVISKLSVGGRLDTHHGGFTTDRHYLWLSTSENSRIYLVDVHSNGAVPRLKGEINGFVSDSSGMVAPHSLLATPGRMLISGLSNAADRKRAGLVEYAFTGKRVRMHESLGDLPYGGEVGLNLRLNRMLTSSFTDKENLARPLQQVLRDERALERSGNYVTVWNYRNRKPLQNLEIPGGPLALRWALHPRHDYAFAVTAFTSKLWWIHRQADGTFAAEAVADIGDAAAQPLPLSISLASDDRHLFVSTFNDGKIRVFDVSEPRKAKQVFETGIGEQVYALAQSWDGRRIYATTSFLKAWDKPQAGHGLTVLEWDDSALKPLFKLDFLGLELGRPGAMFFGRIPQEIRRLFPLTAD